FQLICIGSSGTEKTCLIKHFCDSKFNSGYQATVGVDYGFKVQHLNGIDLRVHLWDLSGSSEYFEVRNELYPKTDGIFIVYDITNSASFESLDYWLKEISKYSTTRPVIFIVGNKIDLQQKRAITLVDGKTFAHNNKCGYFETSALTGEGISEMFQELLFNIMNKKTEQSTDREETERNRRG
ncbi:unnamed protein product, partial [Lymnaea stagnalis]